MKKTILLILSLLFVFVCISCNSKHVDAEHDVIEVEVAYESIQNIRKVCHNN